MKSVRVHPVLSLRGSLQVPGDKSISHRAVMFSALAQGTSHLRGLLLGQDVLATIGCFRDLGVNIEVGRDEVLVHGVGLQGLKAPSRVLDCGNSGTTMRLMMGILSAQPFTTRLTGDESLNRRPMERVAQPLRQMGAQIEEMRASPTERVVKIEGRPLRGIDYALPMASAQVKSAVLLAGLFASGKTRVREPEPSRNHTELLLAHKGAPIQQEENGWISIQKADRLQADDLGVPSDISSAAFFLVGGCLGQDSEVVLKSVGVNPTRTGILDSLQGMGAAPVRQNESTAVGEAVADLRVRTAKLKGTLVSGSLIPRLIDEIPALCIAAAQAQGLTEIRDAAELRVKETDRIQSIATELAKAGVAVETAEDGLRIQGPQSFGPAVYQSHGDHRIAMSMAIASCYASEASVIEDVECIETSYPGFFQDLEKLGGRGEPI